MKTPVFDFTIDREYQCIRFDNYYWFPISDFNKFDENNVSFGLFHLSKKNWVNKNLLNNIFLFCKKEFPNSDFEHTLNYINQRNIYLKSIFTNE